MKGGPIDHVGIVVKDLDRTRDVYTQTLGFDEIYRETVVDQGVEALGLQAGESVIELIRPLTENHPAARWLGDEETKLHHIAYRVGNLEAEIAQLKDSGVRMIDQRPRRGAHSNRIAFIHPKSTAGVLTELCEHEH